MKAWMIVLTLLLAGCGNQGPLYLPPAKTPATSTPQGHA